jgi:hypothetical protein
MLKGHMTFQANASIGNQWLGISEGDISMGESFLDMLAEDVSKLSLHIDMLLDNSQGDFIFIHAYMRILTTLFRP